MASSKTKQIKPNLKSYLYMQEISFSLITFYLLIQACVVMLHGIVLP